MQNVQTISHQKTPLFAQSLTPREGQVLALMGQGMDCAAIASQLGLSNWTVAHLTSRVVRKLGARSRTHAACLAVAWEMFRTGSA